MTALSIPFFKRKQSRQSAEITPDFTTEFLTSENLMVQTFTPRVKLVADLTTGEINVHVDNEVAVTYIHATMQSLPAIQRSVQNIVNQLK